MQYAQRTRHAGCILYTAASASILFVSEIFVVKSSIKVMHVR